MEFPPLHEYVLRDRPGEDAIRLGEGNPPVYAHRLRCRDRRIGASESQSFAGGPPLRTRWLATLIGVPWPFLPAERRMVEIEYEDDAQYVADAVRERDSMLLRIAWLRDRLVGAGAM